MLKMKSRHVAGTITKKKKSEYHCFCLSLVINVKTEFGGGGSSSIWGFEKANSKMALKSKR